jgi:hypothetical protein
MLKVEVSPLIWMCAGCCTAKDCGARIAKLLAFAPGGCDTGRSVGAIGH